MWYQSWLHGLLVGIFSVATWVAEEKAFPVFMLFFLLADPVVRLCKKIYLSLLSWWFGVDWRD